MLSVVFAPVVPLILALTDAIVVTLAGAIAVYFRAGPLPEVLGVEPFSPVRDYFSLWPALVIFLLVRYSYGLYPGFGLNPAEELRRQTLASVLLVSAFAIGGTLFRFSEDYSRLVLGLIALAMIFLVPPGRALVKQILARSRLYGEPTWVLGSSDRADALTNLIRASPQLGLRVAGVGGVPPPNGRIKHCIVLPDDVVERPLSKVLDELSTRFQRVWLVPNLLDVASVWVSPRDLQGHLALELRNNLLEPANRLLKRGSELLLLALSAPIVVPLILLLALLVVIDSPGPAFYRQRRIGRDRKCFEIVKFRTMRADGDGLLERHLSIVPGARTEWDRHQKLKNDPRLTRLGKWLRRYSLDELPQFLNIVKGDMSLVGPRAITEEELCLYGERAHLYTAVFPGLTGLWQVSGRNDISYDDRVRLDSYYMRNWSIWLDLAVLARTPQAVLTSRGAY